MKIIYSALLCLAGSLHCADTTHNTDANDNIDYCVSTLPIEIGYYIYDINEKESKQNKKIINT